MNELWLEGGDIDLERLENCLFFNNCSILLCRILVLWLMRDGLGLIFDVKRSDIVGLWVCLGVFFFVGMRVWGNIVFRVILILYKGYVEDFISYVLM